MPKICLIYNFAQHYRTNIFTLMDKELDYDFVFGNHYLDIKKMDYSQIVRGRVTEVQNRNIGPIEYQVGVSSIFHMNYDAFIILGSPMYLSTWILLIKSKFSRKRVYLFGHMDGTEKKPNLKRL